jgi:DNA-binding protein
LHRNIKSFCTGPSSVFLGSCSEKADQTSISAGTFPHVLATTCDLMTSVELLRVRAKRKTMENAILTYELVERHMSDEIKQNSADMCNEVAASELSYAYEREYKVYQCDRHYR